MANCSTSSSASSGSSARQFRRSASIITGSFSDSTRIDGAGGTVPSNRIGTSSCGLYPASTAACANAWPGSSSRNTITR